ncbi:MAG: hypothetical protein ACKO96_33465, partial [Flammeovirgaceae bacterium]
FATFSNKTYLLLMGRGMGGKGGRDGVRDKECVQVKNELIEHMKWRRHTSKLYSEKSSMQKIEKIKESKILKNDYYRNNRNIGYHNSSCLQYLRIIRS